MEYGAVVEFIHLATFSRSAAALFSEQEVFDLELALLFAPEAGALIPGGRGLRKLRRPLAGRGKSGGARVIYYHVSSDAIIYLVFAYAKSSRDNLTPAQLRQLAALLP